MPSLLENCPVYALWAFREEGEEEALTDQQKIAILQEQNYAGFSGFEHQVEDSGVFERAGLIVPGLYLSVDPAKYQKGSWPDLMEPRLKRYSHSSSDGSVWLVLVNRDGTTAMQEQTALEVIRDAAEWAENEGKSVCLYSHSGPAHYYQNAHQATEYLNASGCGNLGIVLTVYHEVRCGNAGQLESIIEAVMPYARFVCMCGALQDEKARFGWDLTTLDRCDYDLPVVIGKLHELEYSGPIGFYSQQFGRPSEENLARHMRVWKEQLERLP